ncbi:MAG TPA: DUF1361 domain-containing protein [Chthoniobacteraceae bacterium]|nr:DUF1361 domain-containing protein [Chthoniobacteraceae bacterium]
MSRLAPVLRVLLFGSLVCFGMLGARQVRAHSLELSFFYGNLLLAWIPLCLSLLLRRMEGEGGWKRGGFWLAGLLWVCFYPNSFYIVTDFFHLPQFGLQGQPFWYDMMVAASFAFAGVFLGSLALYLLHLVFRERFGYRAGWVFSVVMLALGSFGIYVGRFLRWNSWEVFTQPWKLWGHVPQLVGESNRVAAFSITFFFFSLMAYFFVVAMARLHEDEVRTP